VLPVLRLGRFGAPLLGGAWKSCGRGGSSVSKAALLRACCVQCRWQRLLWPQAAGGGDAPLHGGACVVSCRHCSLLLQHCRRLLASYSSSSLGPSAPLSLPPSLSLEPASLWLLLRLAPGAPSLSASEAASLLSRVATASEEAQQTCFHVMARAVW